MLGKIFKYDMKAMNRSMIPGYIIVFVLALFTKGMFMLSNKFHFMQTFSGLFLAVFIFAIFGIFFYVFLASVLRFYKNFIREEGYLTHTLPISKNTLLFSKLLTFLIHFIVTFIVVILSVMLLIPDYSIVNNLFTIAGTFITELGYSVPGVIIYMIIMFLVSILSNILLFYLAMCLGQTRNDKKVLYSIIYGVILYSIVQMVGVIFTLIIGLSNPGVFENANAAMPDKSFLNLMFGYSSILSFVIMVVYYVMSVRILDKKLNLE